MDIGYVATGGDTFILPIMEHFAGVGHTVTRPTDITARILEDLDVLWLEWANEATIQITAGLAGMAKRPRVIVRCHSYEALAGHCEAVTWSSVDKVIFVSDHVRKYVEARCPLIAHKSVTIPNGLAIPDAPPTFDKSNKNIFWAGDLNHKKGPMLFAEVVKALRPFGYQFHAIPRTVDPRFDAYIQHTLRPDDVVWHPPRPRSEMAALYSEMGWVLSTSPWESFQYMVAEAVMHGCIPLVHAWPGWSQFYPNAWESVKEVAEWIQWMPNSFGEEAAAKLRGFGETLMYPRLEELLS
jgi:glycosyltransferase involved in cell wall biosynthesis